MGDEENESEESGEADSDDDVDDELVLRWWSFEARLRLGRRGIEGCSTDVLRALRRCLTASTPVLSLDGGISKSVGSELFTDNQSVSKSQGGRQTENSSVRDSVL